MTSLTDKAIRRHLRKLERAHQKFVKEQRAFDARVKKILAKK